MAKKTKEIKRAFVQADNLDDEKLAKIITKKLAKKKAKKKDKKKPSKKGE